MNDLRGPLPRTPRLPCDSQAISAVPHGVADLFKIGIGPSSSHTVGPMKAASDFRERLLVAGIHPARLRVIVHGSLAWTGKGHATDMAVVLGLCGDAPDAIDPDEIPARMERIERERVLPWRDGVVAFDAATDIVFDFGPPPARHPNAVAFEAFAADGLRLARETYYSVGGGFIEREGEAAVADDRLNRVRYRYRSGDELLALARREGLSLADLARINEEARDDSPLDARLDRIAAVMFATVERGLSRRGVLPGGLMVRRRAADLHDRLLAGRAAGHVQPNETMDFVSAFAMAVNEENAAGGRIVTAPTNEASGVLPAVLRFHRDYCGGDAAGARTILLTATLVGDLIKRRASISGAEVGCQGEVGSAAAMAAAGLCAALGGTPEQVLNAAEIGLEHHLGMTCDPIGGLVQIPCIERNAFGAVKAISAASLALHGDGSHRVSLDQAIETMRQTGLDMMADYRETSRGGLAVNVPEC